MDSNGDDENIVISGTAYLISSVSIDLSKYALDICKTIIGKSNTDARMDILFILLNCFCIGV